MPAEAKHSLGRRTLSAGAWTIGARLAAKVIDLVLLMCLARFLGPADFGLVAMAMAVVFIVEALFELPMAAALIREPVLDAPMLSTAFTLGLLRGIVIALLLVALAWPLAAFNNEPRLGPLLAVLALAPAMRGLASPRMVEFARALNFRPEASLEVAGKVAAFAVSLALAIGLGSYWAIAAATVCAPLVSTVLSYVIAPLRPRLTLAEWPRFASLIGWNFVSQLFQALSWQLDRLLLPRFTPSIGAFGQYSMAKQISEIPLQALLTPLHRPAMAALAASGEGMAQRYLQMLRVIVLLLAPVLLLLVLWPQPLLWTALGPAWLPAAEWLRWLTVVLMLGMPTFLLGALTMTLDRTHWLAACAGVDLGVKLPLVWLGAQHAGIPGAIAGSGAATLASTLLTLFLVRRLIGAGLWTQLRTLGSPLLALVPAGALLWWAEPWVMAATSSHLLEFLLRAVCIGLLYLLLYALMLLGLWAVAGRPAGVEQSALDLLSRRVRRVRAVP